MLLYPGQALLWSIRHKVNHISCIFLVSWPYRGSSPRQWQFVHFREEWQKLIVFAFMAIFVSYCPLFWGARVINMAHDTHCMFERHDQKLIVFVFVAVFISYCHSFGVLDWFTRSMTLSTCLRGMTKNLSFLRLWPFLWAIAHSFGLPGWFTRPMTLSTCLRGMTKISLFLRLWPF
jgi:hypothetical protein